eukprot:2038995-Prymnesium_polylepis.1
MDPGRGQPDAVERETCGAVECPRASERCEKEYGCRDAERDRLTPSIKSRIKRTSTTDPTAFP